MPLCAGRGWGVECASALGRGPVSGGLWPRIPFEGNSKGTLEFPSKGIRRELEGNSGIPFEGNSKGTRRVLEVLRVVSGTSCNHAHGPEFGPGWLQNTVFYWDYDDRFKPSTL